jgi:hypothetical protein
VSETVGDWEWANNVYVYVEETVGRHRYRRRRRLGVPERFRLLASDTLASPQNFSLPYSRVGAGAARAGDASKILPGAGAA